MSDWFEVNKDGLAKLREGRSKAFIVYELVQNALDTDTHMVFVEFHRIPNSHYVEISVTDDNPSGFKRLSDAFTLFAESEKKDNPEKRGRFNLGEKLVLALCKSAEIASTTGTIIFNGEGRRTSSRKLDAGTRFVGTIRMTEADVKECIAACGTIIVPDHIKLFVNGIHQPHNAPVSAFEATLQTEIADADGVMRKSQRKTAITLHSTQGDQAMLYEMGIPVVEIDGSFHVNVQQKVPLNFDRDNVTPAYLRKLHALVIENSINLMTDNEARAGWVTEALETNAAEMSDATISALADRRFGEKRVSYDPSDPEANAIATSQGYTVVTGGMLPKGAWDALKRAEAIKPAGQVTPSAKPYSNDPNAPTVKVIPEEDWTLGMLRTGQYAKWFAENVLGFKITVRFVHTTNGFGAAYGGRQMDFNVLRLGHAFFDGQLEQITDLVIHELGHEYESNHLSDNYYKALTRIGAKATMAALMQPNDFLRFTYQSFVELNSINTFGRKFKRA